MTRAVRRRFRCEPDAGPNIAAMVGVVLVLLALFVVGPIGLFVVGALWSGLFGWFAVGDAAGHADDPERQSAS